MECSSCGFVNPDQARFCGGCGEKFPVIECGHCQTENASGSRFCNACGKPLADVTQKPLGYSQAERRILTVLFCDLVDSTVLVDRLDPELSRIIIRDFQLLSKEIIEKLGGRITTYLGDGIVALFSGHESNAERAINTALQINRRIEQGGGSFDETDLKIAVRCGIATGLAVVGDDMLGHSRIRLETAIGLPMNMAARIQGLAEPGGVAVGDATYQSVHGLFEFEDFGEHELKGIEEPQKVWRVVAEKSISSRFVAHASRMTPMVDRTEMLQSLMDAWDKSMQGNAQPILLMGEAGVGKSRISQELADIISIKNEFQHLEYQCSPYHVNTALYPVINRLKAAAAFELGESHEDQLKKLEQLLQRSSRDYEHDMPAFAELLSLPESSNWPSPNLEQEARKEWIFVSLINNILDLSESLPLLVTIEDIHWIDPTTLELFVRILSVISSHPILIVLTSRPESVAAEALQAFPVQRLVVGRLPGEYSQQLARQVRGESQLPERIVDEIVQRTEGIPLYIEELSKSVIESMSSRRGEGDSTAALDLQLPANLHESLLARLEHLPDETRSIARLASVIGRDFSFNLLEKVAEYEDNNLYGVLTPLFDAQLVIQRKAPPNAQFSFKHALVRDVAYQTLLISDRSKIHKRIAEVIENNYTEISRNSPELLAKHYTEGKVYEKALEYWLNAGKKASYSSATAEARAHLEMGLSLLEHLDDTQFRDQMELRLLLVLGPIMISTAGPGSKESLKIYQRALEISEGVDDTDLKFITLWNNWRMVLNEGFAPSIPWSNRLLEFAQRSGEIDQRLQAHHCLWATLYNLGDQASCHEHIEHGLALYDFDQHARHASSYGGHDPKVCALSQSALSLWLRGYPDQAAQRMERAIAFTEELNHFGSRLHNIDTRLMLYKFMGDYERLMKAVDELSQICEEERQLQEYEAKVSIFSGWALSMSNEDRRGLHMLEEGVAKQESTGTWEDRPVYKEMLAQLKQKLGLYEQGINDIENAIIDANEKDVSYWNAELYRRKGELIMLNNSADFDIAESAFNEAREIAMSQDAKSLELRAAVSLARLYLAAGENDEARSALQPIYLWFTEGQKTRDMENAASLLESVSS